MKKMPALLFVIIFILAIFLSMPAAAQEHLIERSRQFIDLLNTNDFEKATALFDARMQEAAPADKLEDIWEKLVDSNGELLKKESNRTDVHGEYFIVFTSCTFENVTIDLKIVFNTDEEIAGFFVVPTTPKVQYKPASYVEPNNFFTFDTSLNFSQWVLPAKITFPDSDGKFPAIVLVHGSGPSDMDETIGPNKIFRDLAEGLSSRDIIVLRYDKRTKVHARLIDSLKTNITLREETIDDALSAVSLLRMLPEVDRDKIFVLGHSLGGMALPRMAKLYPRIAGFILMAAPARPLNKIIVEQADYLQTLSGGLTEKKIKDLDNLKKQAGYIIEDSLKLYLGSGRRFLGAPAEYWLDLLQYNQVETARKLRHPLLIMQGERDYQVTLRDYTLWKEKLNSKKGVTFKLYPRLNHLFFSGKGKSGPDEYSQARNVDEQVVEDIAEWVKKQ